MDFKNTTMVGTRIREVPRHRWAAKIRDTAVGLAFVGGAGYAAVELSWPWYVVLPVAVFGGLFISRARTKRGADFVVALVKDLLAAVKGKNGAAPTP